MAACSEDLRRGALCTLDKSGTVAVVAVGCWRYGLQEMRLMRGLRWH
jgi:hypothetical protein